MVALPRLSNFCCCTSLKTGTLIIGSLNLVASVISILASIGFMAGSAAMSDLVEQLWDQTPSDRDDDFVKKNGHETTFSAVNIGPTGIFLFGVIILISSIFSIVISACMVHGARTRNVCLMKPWIVLTGINLINPIFLISILGWMVLTVINRDNPFVLINIFGWLIGAYFFLVVWSFKKEIEDKVEGGEGYMLKA